MAKKSLNDILFNLNIINLIEIIIFIFLILQIILKFYFKKNISAISIFD